MVIVPSVAMVTQTFGDSGPSAKASPPAPSPSKARGSGATVSASVRPTAAPKKSRRLKSRRLKSALVSMCLVMTQPSRAARWIALMIFR